MLVATISVLLASGLAGVTKQEPLSVSPTDWLQLNATLGGRLIEGRPFASACFEHDGGKVPYAFKSPKCVAARRGYFNESKSSADRRPSVHLFTDELDSFA